MRSCIPDPHQLTPVSSAAARRLTPFRATSSRAASPPSSSLSRRIADLDARQRLADPAHGHFVSPGRVPPRPAYSRTCCHHRSPRFGLSRTRRSGGPSPAVRIASVLTRRAAGAGPHSSAVGRLRYSARPFHIERARAIVGARPSRRTRSGHRRHRCVWWMCAITSNVFLAQSSLSSPSVRPNGQASAGSFDVQSVAQVLGCSIIAWWVNDPGKASPSSSGRQSRLLLPPVRCSQ